MLQLNLSKQAERFLLSLTSKDNVRVVQEIEELLSDPFPYHSIQMKGNFKSCRRIKAGSKIRIVYQAENGILSIFAIGYRADIYKKFPPQDSP